MSTIKVNTLTTLDGTGNITVSRPLSGSGASLTALNATELGSGTVPTARLGSGTANNTVFLRGDGTWDTAGSTSASDLSSGTLPMARLSGTLPALNGSALTALNATQLTSGTIPIARLGNDVIDSQHYAAASIDNEHLASGIDAAKITTGTLPMARLSGTLPALNGSALTNLPSSFPGGSVGFKTHRDLGNVSLSANTWTKLITNSQTWDLGNDYDSSSNYRFDAPTTGKYWFLGVANFSSLADQDHVRLSFSVSGTLVSPHVGGASKQHASGTAELCNSISAYLSLSSGQYVELYAYSNATNVVNSGQILLAGFQVS